MDSSRKKIWAYVGGGILVAALIAALVFFLVNDSGRKRRHGSNKGVQVEQAHWKIRVHTVAGQGLPKKTRHVTKRATGNLEDVVRGIYNALILRPGKFDKVAGTHMLPSAAADLESSGIKIPEKARRVKTLKREAKIGVEASSSRRAAAEVVIVVKGKAEHRKFRAASHDKLWIERHEGKWRVIAYELNREPVSGKAASGTADKHAKKGGKPKSDKPGKKSGGGK